MTKLSRRQFCMTGLALAGAAPLAAARPAAAQQLKGGTLRVGVRTDVAVIPDPELIAAAFDDELAQLALHLSRAE